MSTKYPPQSIVGYNVSPPPDDGTQVAANQLTWVKHKTKLGDPLKTLAEDINTALVAHFDNGPVPVSAPLITDTTHYNQILEVTGTTTISLGDAATMTSGYFLTVANTGVDTVTVDLAFAADTLNGVVGGSVTLLAGDRKTYVVNTVANGYFDTASAIANTARVSGTLVNGNIADFDANGNITNSGLQTANTPQTDHLHQGVDI